MSIKYERHKLHIPLQKIKINVFNNQKVIMQSFNLERTVLILLDTHLGGVVEGFSIASGGRDCSVITGGWIVLSREFDEQDCSVVTVG